MWRVVHADLGSCRWWFSLCIILTRSIFKLQFLTLLQNRIERVMYLTWVYVHPNVKVWQWQYLPFASSSFSSKLLPDESEKFCTILWTTYVLKLSKVLFGIVDVCLSVKLRSKWMLQGLMYFVFFIILIHLLFSHTTIEYIYCLCYWLKFFFYIVNVGLAYVLLFMYLYTNYSSFLEIMNVVPETNHKIPLGNSFL